MTLVFVRERQMEIWDKKEETETHRGVSDAAASQGMLTVTKAERGR